MNLRAWPVFFTFVNAATVFAAAPAAELPAYRAEQPVSGEFRVWGSPADSGLIRDLGSGFAKYHPGVQFKATLYGPESTMAGLYNGVADLAFMAREMRLPVESMAFEWVHRYKAFEVEVANVGLGMQRPAANLAVFVHKDNPLAHLSLAQLEAILGAEHRRSATNIRDWAELGLGAGWQGKPIHVYGPEVDSIAALYVRSRVLGDSRKWNPDYRELASDGAAIRATLARDPLGIAYAPLGDANPGIKAIALGESDAGPFYPLTADNVAARSYPLTRTVQVVVDRAPGKPLDPKVKEFLRYVLSREGQAAIARDGVYIPLSTESVQRQLRRLE